MMSAVKKRAISGGTFKLYKSYSFKEKDPIIDILRTVVQDEGASYAEIERASGVTTSTLYNWFSGGTRRPQFASVMAVTRGLGYDLKLVKKGQTAKLVRIK